MAKKARKSIKKKGGAGAKNLAKWKIKNPQGGALTHGAYSKHIRKRYTDKRTTEGHQLHMVIKGLKEDIGQDLSTAQCLLLDRIREKLIVLLQIGKYVDQQPSIIDKDGKLIGCLSHGYSTFSECLRRDLEALSVTTKNNKPLSYEKAMKILEDKNHGKGSNSNV